MEDDFDLRPYIVALLKYRWWIIGAVVLTIVVTFFAVRLETPTYEAKATIAIIRSRTDVSFGSQIQTLSEGELEMLNVDISSRRAALIGLVKSDVVAAQVLTVVSDLLPEDERSITALLEMIEVEGEGDLIHILVQFPDAEVATQIVNSWAAAFEQTANRLYSASGDTDLLLVMEQIETAKLDYELSQDNVEVFLRDNKIEFLQREIDANKEILNAYQSIRNNIQADSIKLQSDNQQLTLAAYYDDLKQIELWLIEADALREQIRMGQNSNAEKLANTLALITLQSEVYGGSAPVELQVQLNESMEGVELEQIDTFINGLRHRRDVTNMQIAQLYDELSVIALSSAGLETEHPINSKIGEINDMLGSLEAQKEAEEAQKLRLEQSRDLDWETYQTLTRKLAEIEIAAQTLGSEVRFASPSVPSRQPVGNQMILKLLTTALLSFGSAMTVVIVREWWRVGFRGS